MTCLFRWNGLTSIIDNIAVPGDTQGFGDIGSPVANSFIFPTSLGPRLVLKNGFHPNRTTHVVLEGNDYALGNDIFYWAIPPTPKPGVTPTSAHTGPWSLSMIFRIPTPTFNLNFLSFRNAGVANITFARLISANRIARTASPAVTTMPSATDWYRLEIQADPNRTASLVWRLYVADALTPIGGHSETGVTVSWDELRLGYLNSGFTSIQATFGEIEVHDDYDLGGQFRSSPKDGVTPASTTAEGVPLLPPIIPARYRYNAATNKTLSRTNPSYTTHSNVSYTTVPANYGRRYDLYIPNDGEPPPGGYPVVMWGHPGFFSEGSKLDIPLEWLKEMIAARIAVCSVQYVKTAIELGGSYLSYGTNDKYGRYPSFIHDYKLATVDLKAKASTLSGGNNTYNVNGNKIIACGFSAAGYIALAAAMTKNLNEDSAGTKMSLAGATAAGLPWGGGYTGADPDYLGAMVFAAPIDMDVSRNWDPTHPNSGSLIRLLGYRGFQGLISNGSDAPLYPRQSIVSLIERNSLSNLCPVAYIEGSADFLVHWEHQELLANALASKGVDYTRILTPNNHNHGNDIFDIEEQLVWLNSILYPSSGPESKTLFFSSGTTETGVSTEFYDGTENISKDLSKI